MMFFVQCIRNSRKNKNRQPIRAAVFNPPAEIYSVSFLTTHRRKLSFPIKGTLALHCQVARLVSESFLMLRRNRTEPVSAYNKNLCHSRKPALSDQRGVDLISYALPFGRLWIRV
jgi:hypothetical protein